MLVPLLSSTAVQADDVITFADANVKAICVENWDTNNVTYIYDCTYQNCWSY